MEKFTGVKKKLLIFDLDGTLVDSKEDLAASVNHTLKTLGKEPLPPEEIYAEVGGGARNLIEKALGEDGHLFGDAIKIFLDHYEEHLLDTTRPYEGVVEALEENLGRFTYALLTNKPLYLTEKLLRGLSMEHLFHVVAGGDTFSTKKPDPEGVLSLISLAGVSREETLIVGDSRNDVLAGRNAGVDVCGVTYGIGARDFSLYPPTFTIDSFPDLFRAVTPA